jgi:hypothetical protein
MIMKYVSPPKEVVSHDSGYLDNPQSSCGNGSSNEHCFSCLSWMYTANLVIRHFPKEIASGLHSSVLPNIIFTLLC